MAQKRTEHAEQSAFFDYVRWKANQDWRYYNVMAVPNAGRRGVFAGARMKREGMSKGFPDVVCFISNGCHNGLILEFKIAPNKPTPEQEDWLDRLHRAGYLALVVWSADEAIAVLDSYLLLTTQPFQKLIERSPESRTRNTAGPDNSGKLKQNLSVGLKLWQDRKRRKKGG